MIPTTMSNGILISSSPDYLDATHATVKNFNALNLETI